MVQAGFAAFAPSPDQASTVTKDFRPSAAEFCSDLNSSSKRRARRLAPSRSGGSEANPKRRLATTAVTEPSFSWRVVIVDVADRSMPLVWPKAAAGDSASAARVSAVVNLMRLALIARERIEAHRVLVEDRVLVLGAQARI